MDQVGAWVLALFGVMIGSVIVEAMFSPVSFWIGRREWRTHDGASQKQRQIDEHADALVFTAMIDGLVGTDPRWVAVVADSTGVIGTRAKGMTAFSLTWADIRDVRQRWDGIQLKLDRLNDLTLIPITDELKRAGDAVAADGVRRLLAKRDGVHA